MGKKTKRKFIDPSKDVIHKFKLVHRSQQDPLAAEGSAAQHVLAEVKQPDRNKEILAEEYGIYVDPDDEYDYLQHIRDSEAHTDAFTGCEMEEVYTIRNDDLHSSQISSSKKKLLLPSTVFESAIEESVGLLNKDVKPTGPQLGFDPDIVAELDKDADEDREEMDDDFFVMMNKNEPLIHENESTTKEDWDDMGSFSSDFDLSDDDDAARGFDEMDDFDFTGNQNKTNKSKIASMSNISKYTKVSNRTENLKQMDANFVATWMKEYDDIEPKEAEGKYAVEDDYFKRLLQPVCTKDREEEANKDRQAALDFVKRRMELNNGDSELPEEFEKIKVQVRAPTLKDLAGDLPSSKKRTCHTPTEVSFNFTNKKIKLNKKNDKKKDDEELESPKESISFLCERLADETPEDRRLRKAAYKEYRREQRKMKKRK